MNAGMVTNVNVKEADQIRVQLDDVMQGIEKALDHIETQINRIHSIRGQSDNMLVHIRSRANAIGNPPEPSEKSAYISRG